MCILLAPGLEERRGSCTAYPDNLPLKPSFSVVPFPTLSLAPIPTGSPSCPQSSLCNGPSIASSSRATPAKEVKSSFATVSKPPSAFLLDGRVSISQLTDSTSSRDCSEYLPFYVWKQFSQEGVNVFLSFSAVLESTGAGISD